MILSSTSKYFKGISCAVCFCTNLFCKKNSRQKDGTYIYSKVFSNSSPMFSKDSKGKALFQKYSNFVFILQFYLKQCKRYKIKFTPNRIWSQNGWGRQGKEGQVQ